MNDYLTVEDRASQPVRLGETQLILIEKVLSLQPPGMWGLFFWRRPKAVVVQSPQNGRQVIAIPDVTRMAQLTILGVGLLFSLLAWFFFRKK